MRAPDILKKAAQHMEDRAAARDQPEGERSMARTVAAFNALTGHQLTERDGWMFMVALKAARACNTPAGIADDYEDGAAYFGLAGEAAAGSISARSEAFDRASDTVRVSVPMSGEFVNVCPDGAIEIPIEGAGMARVPPGYSWIAQDASGLWYAYKSKPVAERVVFWPAGREEPARIGHSDPNPNWRDTLRRVRD